MDIKVISNCIAFFWPASKMTRTWATKGPAVAYTGVFGLFQACCSQQPISDLTDITLRVGKGCLEYPMAGRSHGAGNGLANTSVHPSCCITSSARSVGSLSAGSYRSRNSQIPVFSTSDKDKPWRCRQYSRHVTHFICLQSSCPMLRQGVSPGWDHTVQCRGKKLWGSVGDYFGTGNIFGTEIYLGQG